MEKKKSLSWYDKTPRECRKRAIVLAVQALSRFGWGTLDAFGSNFGFGSTGRLTVNEAKAIFPRSETTLKALCKAGLIRKKGIYYELTPWGKEVSLFVKRAVKLFCHENHQFNTCREENDAEDAQFVQD